MVALYKPASCRVIPFNSGRSENFSSLLLAIGLDVVLCANAGIGEGDHEAWECEMKEHEVNPNSSAASVWNELKNL